MSWFKFPHIEETSLRIKALRYFMTIFCFFFLVFGFSVITCGAVLTSKRPDECLFLSRFYIGVYFLLASGCATVFFSVVVCVRTQSSTCAQDFVSVSVVAMIIFGLQIFAAVASHVFYVNASHGELKADMNSTWQAYYTEGTHCVDTLQRKFECCGVDSPAEWVSLSVNASAISPYPLSCRCTSTDDQCTLINNTFANNSYTSYVLKTSCHDVILDELYHTLLFPRILGPVISLVEFLFILAALYFLHHLHNHSLVGAYIVTSPPSQTEDAQAQNESCCPNGLELAERLPTPPLRVGVSRQDSLSVSHDETVMHI